VTKVYFLRHGKAESRSEWCGDDGERPLTAEGEEALRREAQAMRALDLGLDAIVTSPLARARRTAEIVADGLGLRGRLEEDERLAHGFDVRRLEQVLAAHESAGVLMVVGHEPDFSATVAELIGGGDIVMKKGGLARVDVTAPVAGGGELVWLLTPPLLGSR
jgi:phosphohistidine phosphatase